MAYSSCDTVPDIKVAEVIPDNSLVEVVMWEAFIIYHYDLHARFLLNHSFDQTPVFRDDMPTGRICYRFTKQIWEDHIKTFLFQNRIPVQVRLTGHLQEESITKHIVK
jgi:hypothetical protein